MRVELREVLDEDVGLFYVHQADPESSAMADFPSRNESDHTAHWSKILADPAVVTRTVLADGDVVGNVTSWEHDEERDVGYWIDRRHWGRGIASAALQEFVNVLPYRPLHAHVAKHNLGSLKVLERSGFQIVHRAEDNGSHDILLRLD